MTTLHPHSQIHAIYSGSDAAIDLVTGNIIAGDLPRRKAKLTMERIELHRDELTANWQRAELHEPLLPIAPLS